ncbi:hypothetical protein EX30DRAFT_394728 [Ascodesmis nigricans]|uniref:Ubiquitin-like domain-containing protein n=1 Tax=Ascodesmis nigricans TaxID=341454 RepID=A0A4S2N0D2_9PEZI|nr:hypothetical protein EX30DRAFT_394728 [Ascodesmis nigricans]
MSTPASRGQTPQPSEPVDNNLNIRIVSLSPDVPPNLSYTIEPTSTVDDLKRKIQETVNGNPALDQQKLIYGGKVLEGSAQFGPIVINNTERQPWYTVHLVLKPAQNASTSSSAPSAQNTATDLASTTNAHSSRPPLTSFAVPELRATPTSPITRTTTTISSYTAGPSTVTTRTTQIATSFPIGQGINSLSQLAGLLPPLVAGSGSQGLGTVPSSGASGTRLPPEIMDRFSEQLQTLLQRGPDDTGANSTTNGTTGNPTPGLYARRSANSSGTEARGLLPSQPRIPEISGILGARSGMFGSDSTSAAGFSPQTFPGALNNILPQGANSTNPAGSNRGREIGSSLEDMQPESHTRANAVANTSGQHAAQAEPAVYMLVDPNGRPHSLVVPPNRPVSSPHELISGLSFLPPVLNSGQAPAENITNGVLSSAAAPSAHELAPNDLVSTISQQLDDVNRNIEALSLRIQRAEALLAVLNAHRARANGMNVQQLGERVRQRAGHLWLAMKLAVFVFLFSGNGGMGRLLSLTTAAILIFLWQTGLVRPIIEAVNPPPPQAGAHRAAMHNNHNQHNNQAQPNQPNQQADAPLQAANPDPTDPARAAQIIIERHEGTSRRMFRALENGVGLFLASLVPGLHERHVEAAERRDQELRRARGGVQQSEQPSGAENGQLPPAQDAEQRAAHVAIDDPQNPQDQPELRRRELRARVEDAEDNLMDAGIRMGA